MLSVDSEIRRATISDAPAVASFAARTFAETFGPDNRPEDMAEYLASAYGEAQQRAELSDPDYVTLVVDAPGNGLLAFAQVRRHPQPDCVEGDAPVELFRFYVDRPAHGSGLAQRLMKVVENVALAMRGGTLWLGVWERNLRAAAFYRKCGFRDVGSHQFLVGTDSQTDRIMVKQLTELRR